MYLPTELYPRIFEYLRLNDRIKISNVSNFFNQLNEKVEYSYQVTFNEMVKFPEYIVNIKLDIIPWTTQYSEFLNEMNQIKKLDITPMNLDTEDFNRLKLPSLEVLYLDQCENDSDDFNILSILERVKSFAQLKELSISMNEMDETHFEFIRELSHLESIKLTINDNMINEDLENLSNIDNIKELDLHSCDITESEHFRRFKNLKKLNIHENCVIDLIYNLQNSEIKYLTLSHNALFSCDDFIHFQSMKRLKSLELFPTKFLFGLIHLKRLKSLTTLILSPSEMSLTLIAILNELQSLQHLKLIFDCENYRDKDLIYIKELKKLETLEIEWFFHRTNNTRSILSQLQQLKNATKMILPGNIKQEDINLLKEHLPDTEIEN